VSGNISAGTLKRKVKKLEAELNAGRQTLAELSLNLERFTTHYQIIPTQRHNHGGSGTTLSWGRIGRNRSMIF